MDGVKRKIYTKYFDSLFFNFLAPFCGLVSISIKKNRQCLAVSLCLSYKTRSETTRDGVWQFLYVESNAESHIYEPFITQSRS